MGVRDGLNSRADYAACAAKGMTVGETASFLGVSPTAVSMAATRYGLKFSRANGKKRFAKPSSAAKPNAREKLKPDQQIDVSILVQKGGYTEDEAIRIVTAPKTKIRLGKPPEKTKECEHEPNG